MASKAIPPKTTASTRKMASATNGPATVRDDLFGRSISMSLNERQIQGNPLLNENS
jgi:hypothetical protein